MTHPATCSSCGGTGELVLDLCRACYQRAWKADTLPPRKPRTYSEPVECQHDGRHRHGTRTMYVQDRCRCEPCTASNRVQARDRARRKAISQWQDIPPEFVDGDVVRAHIRGLRDAGMGRRAIAKAAGINESVMTGILYGFHRDNPSHPAHKPPRKRVRAATAAKILAVKLDLASGANVDPTGTRRRIQALVAIGWPKAQLDAALGFTPGRVSNLMRSPTITRATQKRIAELYEALWNSTPQPSAATTRARRHAQARKWAPPMAWDDDRIDDPRARPSGRVPTTAPSKTRRQAA